MKKIYFLITLLIFSIIAGKISFAYQLMGIKWSGGAYNYTINPIGVDNAVNYSAKNSTIINAAALWTTVSTSNVQVNYQGTSANTGWGVNDGENVVTWVTNGWTGSVIGISTSWFTSQHIIDSDIKLNTSFANDSRVSQLVTHEVGHSLGIDHTQESGASYEQDEYDAIMYWLLHSQTELNRQDKCAITAIYPASGSCLPTYGSGYFDCLPCCSDDGSVSVTITNNTYTYSASAKTVTVTTSPPGLAHTVAYLDAFDNPVASPVNVGLYDVVVTITESGYESEGPFYGTLTINKKALTATAQNKTVTYGDAQPAYTIAYSGFAGSETSSVLNTLPTAGVSGTWPLDPGNYPITVNGGSDDNYSFSYQNGTLTVNALTLNNVYVSDYEQNYDGNGKQITVSTDPAGVGHVIAYKLNSTPVATPINAGVYDVTITIDEAGYNADQYLTTLTILKASLTAKANDQNVSIGDPEPVYTISYTGFVNGEDSTELTSLPTADVTGTWPLAAGTYPIVVSGGTDNNYNINRVNGLLTVTAFRADSVRFSNLAFNYDGQPHFPSIITYPNGLDYELKYTNAIAVQVNQPTNAGIYEIELIISETGYARDTFSSNLIISQVPLEISVNDTTIVYGSPQPLYSFNYSGFVNGETTLVLDEHPQASVDDVWPLLPGIYPISLSGGNDNNYQLQMENGNLTIVAAQADSVTFNPLVFQYNGLPQIPFIQYYPDTISYTTVLSNNDHEIVTTPIDAGSYLASVVVTEPGFETDTFSKFFEIEKALMQVSILNDSVDYGDPEPSYVIQYFGFVNNEDSTVIDTLAVAGVAGTWPLLPGNYPIVFEQEASDNNYSINHQTAWLTVESSGVVLSVSDTIHVYNGLPHEVSIQTLPENILTSVVYLNQQGAVIDPPSNPGQYTVEVEIVEEGFEPLKKTVKLTIQKATLMVEVHDQIINFGDLLPVFTFSISGFVNGENQSVLTSLPVVINPGNNLLPGDYPLRADGGLASNYAFIYMAGNLKVLPLFVSEIIIQDTIITYSSLTSNIHVTTVPEGLDYQTVFYNTVNNPVNPVNAGTYDYIVTITETGYYNSQVKGQLHIHKAPLEVSMLPLQITYGEQQPETEIAFSGWAGNEDTEVIDQLPSISEITNWPWNAGNYSLNYAEGSDNNYRFIYTTGELQILPATLTVTPNDLVLDYNQPLPELAYNITGFQYGEDLSVITQLPVLQVEGEWPLVPGSHPIVASGAMAQNYVFDYQNGHLWIEPVGNASLLISEIVTTYTGTIHWPVITTIPEGLAHDTIVSELPLNAGSYELKVKLTEPGYVPIEESHLIQIEKAVITATARDTAVSRGTDITIFNIDYEGFVNDESISELDQLPSASAGNVATLEAGLHPILLQGGLDNNYSFKLINGLLTIIPTYLIEVIAGENGRVSFDETGNLQAMLAVEVTEGESSPAFYAIPDENYLFSGWDNGITDNPTSFSNVTQNQRVTAQFEAKVGIEESAINSKLKVYPNPVAAYHPFKVNIQWTENDKATLILSDISGQVIAKKTVSQSVQHFEGLQQGIYLITLISEQQIFQPMKLLVR
jgi:hypothetical protein